MVVYERIAGEVLCEGRRQLIRRGQVLFVPPDTIHSFVVQPGQQTYHVLHFQAAEVSRINPDFRMPVGALLCEAAEEDFACLISLLRWCSGVGTPAAYGVATSMAAATDLVLSLYFEKIAQEGMATATRGRNTFGPLVKYLNGHNKYQLSVEQAAELCHLSRSHFMNKFKRSFGITFNQFLLRRKIQTAKYLLRSSPLSIAEIARQIEMENASYFTKVFKAEVGVTPRVYAGKGE